MSGVQVDKPQEFEGASGGMKRGADEAFSAGSYNPPKMIKPGDWTCPMEGCSNYNYAFRTECQKCNAPKLQSGADGMHTLP
jgi:hypothetical protein